MGIKLPTPPEQDTDSCLGKNRKPLLKFFMRNQNSPLNTILIVVLAKKGAVKLPTPSEQETSLKKWRCYDVTSILHESHPAEQE